MQEINNNEINDVCELSLDDSCIYTFMHGDSFGMNGISHTDITTYKENGNSICNETTWYTDGHIVSKTTITYPDGHRETTTENLVKRCGIAVDPNISDEEFAKLKEKMRGIIADKVLDSDE